MDQIKDIKMLYKGGRFECKICSESYRKLEAVMGGIEIFEYDGQFPLWYADDKIIMKTKINKKSRCLKNNTEYLISCRFSVRKYLDSRSASLILEETNSTQDGPT